VPAVADNGKFQTLALVQAAGGHAVVGNSGAASPAADAFASYRAFLGDRVAGGSGTRIAGTIDRFANAGGRVYFTRVSFEAAPDESGALLVRGFRDGSIAR
jgi:hypothetical protein